MPPTCTRGTRRSCGTSRSRGSSVRRPASPIPYPQPRCCRLENSLRTKISRGAGRMARTGRIGRRGQLERRGEHIRIRRQKAGYGDGEAKDRGCTGGEEAAGGVRGELRVACGAAHAAPEPRLHPHDRSRNPSTWEECDKAGRGCQAAWTVCNGGGVECRAARTEYGGNNIRATGMSMR